MPKVNLSNFGSGVKTQVPTVSDSINEAGGSGAFSVGAGPNGLSINANFNSLVQNEITETEADGPLRNLYSATPFGKTLKFPMDIDDENYIIISVLKKDRQARNSGAKREPLEHIVLPLPSNLVSAHNMNYQNEALGLVGGLASGQIGLQNVKELGEQTVDALGSVFDSTKKLMQSGKTDSTIETIKGIGSGAAVAGIGTALAGKIAGPIGAVLGASVAGQGFASGVSSALGIAVNPHMAVIFQGSTFREHQFSYKFIARSQIESIRLNKIIKRLEYYMLPSYTLGKFAFEYPNEFEIKFSEKHKKYLYNIGDCVLTSMSVNYNGEGIPVFYEASGAPVVVEINLNFQETKIVTRESLGKK